MNNFVSILKELIKIFIFFSLSANCQINNTILELENNHQICLDRGRNMENCSKRYYFQMDSLVNSICNQIEKEMNLEDKSKFKKNHQNWLKKRKKFEIKQNSIFQKKYKSQEWGNEMYLIVYQNDIEFILKRIKYLIKKYKL